MNENDTADTHPPEEGTAGTIEAAVPVDAPVAGWFDTADDQSSPEPVHRATARRATRLATKIAGDAALADVEARRRSLEGVVVMYTPRKGEYGYAGPGVPRHALACTVKRAHNADCADLVHVGEDGVEHDFASCVLAGARDTAPDDVGTFGILG